MQRDQDALLTELRMNMLRNPVCMSMLTKRCITYEAIEKFALGYDTRPTSAMRDRLIFPVRDAYGRVVAWQGRAMTSDLKPKYWHTSGDWKSQVLYGLYECGELAFKKGYMGLVEGNMDAPSAFSAGVPAIATMGTTLSNKQCIMLRRYVSELVIFPDKGEAGEKAAIKWLNQLTKYEFHVIIEPIPGKAKDFNELLCLEGLRSASQMGYSY